MRSALLPHSHGPCLVLAACGGGDGGNDIASGDASRNAFDAAPDMAQPLALSSLSTTTTVTIAANCGLANFAAEALQRLNAWRASGAVCGSTRYAPTAALAWNTPLIDGATGHSKDMVAHNYFSHTGSDGSNPGQRDTRAGYVWSAWGENIAAGQASVASVTGAWMASAGHCANIMNPRFRHVGLACVKGTSTNRYRTYWTLDLGAPR
jgi:uncharacterized protein YkwD